MVWPSTAYTVQSTQKSQRHQQTTTKQQTTLSPSEILELWSPIEGPFITLSNWPACYVNQYVHRRDKWIQCAIPDYISYISYVAVCICVRKFYKVCMFCFNPQLTTLISSFEQPILVIVSYSCKYMVTVKKSNVHWMFSFDLKKLDSRRREHFFWILYMWWLLWTILHAILSKFQHATLKKGLAVQG